MTHGTGTRKHADDRHYSLILVVQDMADEVLDIRSAKVHSQGNARLRLSLSYTKFKRGHESDDRQRNDRSDQRQWAVIGDFQTLAAGRKAQGQQSLGLKNLPLTAHQSPSAIIVLVDG